MDKQYQAQQMQLMKELMEQEKPDGCDKPGKGWVVVYPVFLNNARKVSEGRRVPLSCACRYPSAVEIAELCRGKLKLPFYFEKGKAHPRENIAHVGRVRVRLRNDQGELINDAITSRKVLFRTLGTEMPKLESRKYRIAEHERKQQEYKLILQEKQEKKEMTGNPKKRSNNKKKGKKR